MDREYTQIADRSKLFVTKLVDKNNYGRRINVKERKIISIRMGGGRHILFMTNIDLNRLEV
jgi:hypothetical protein